MFLNAAIDQQLDKFEADNGREPTEDEAEKIREWVLKPTCAARCRPTSSRKTRARTPASSRTEFALKMMGDIQEFFVHNQVQNFYSVSISGYHIAEAGANPISQLAFTLSNGFTYVETLPGPRHAHRRLRAQPVFFFSNGMDPGILGDRPGGAAASGRWR